MKRTYPKEFHAWMAENVPGHSTQELVKMIREAFGFELTECAVRSYKVNHKLKSGTPRARAGRYTKRYPEEVAKFIVANVEGRTTAALAELVNEHFGTSYTEAQLKSYKGNHHLKDGVDCKFKPGHQPHNKEKKGYYTPGCEKGWFKAGHMPHNHHPVGTIIKNTDGYLQQKVGEPNKWKLKHVLVWEEARGPIPDDYILTFKDGDATNCELDNLALVTRAEHLMLTRKGLRFKDKELTESGIAIARLSCKIQKIKKNRGKQ